MHESWLHKNHCRHMTFTATVVVLILYRGCDQIIPNTLSWLYLIIFTFFCNHILIFLADNFNFVFFFGMWICCAVVQTGAVIISNHDCDLQILLSSMFSLRGAGEKEVGKVKLARILFMLNALHVQTAPKGHVNILWLMATQLPITKSICQTVSSC